MPKSPKQQMMLKNKYSLQEGSPLALPL
ncbi:hypothetical protein RJ641_034549 [Dillenia turbinata]|uniref:Uncharacterized protein n=1 Tax=Dillenia turbinata TaxID=194707 RepID=A0AAN8ZBN3_9MAGN